ncbi:MAG: 30S ribosome-binding factor RbfA [Candidatus Eisenbacteria bacterium]
MQSRRISRLCDQIQEEVSDILYRKLKDPRLGFVTITRVKLAPDLSQSNIYVSVMGSPEDIAETIECLDRASSFVRSELGKRLRIKRIPELIFRYDDSAVRGARIESILKDLREGKDGESLQDDI